MSNIKIIVATHKKYEMPQDDMYLPLHVGAINKEDIGYQKDCFGNNISLKNSSYCELTGLYWAWNNLDADYIGLAHYRRHFSRRSFLYRVIHKKKDSILTKKELEDLIVQYKVFLPRKRYYYIETLYSHYAHTHYGEHLDITRRVIEKKYPAYIECFDIVMKQRFGYMFNMYIMKREYSDSYCEWLFDILFEVEKRMGKIELSQFQGRFYGRISEIIFNVWLLYQIKTGVIKKEEIRELSCIHMEKINWWKKGTAFLKAKIIHKKYEGSF